ncbi:DUF4846 domain-containing protein [Flammeovirgaceae bacterium SG7u.111]|nr:DUF4846 domain-containing protein [Flammeovirgaceae bacterium SG7u.132]WPO35485.1 DUF4846 domain-containing protein [Flammeovirgaceae bacterium SG7u.111]
MYRIFLFTSLLLFLLSCTQQQSAPIAAVPEKGSKAVIPEVGSDSLPKGNPRYLWLDTENGEKERISKIAPPANYTRSDEKANSYGEWLRFLPLKPKGSEVRLYNGDKKYSQGHHAAVVNIDVGKRDLQQCADAVMRLRAEYLYSVKKYDNIHFNFTNGQNMPFAKWKNGYKISVKGNKALWVASSSSNGTHTSLRKYMTWIFMYAGTASLSKELKPVAISEVEIGDVFIQGGFPGHAIIVVDMAVSTSGKKVIMLAQSYMPAQDIHVLVNPTDQTLGAWYEVEKIKESGMLITPEWRFTSSDLKRF